jgi:hypothetical protein
MADFKPSRREVTVTGISLTEFNKVGAVTNVADNTKTTIVSQAFVASTFENLTMVTATGEDYAKFFVTLNGTDIDVRRSGPDRNIVFDFTGAPYKLVSGDVVDVKVEHFNTGELVDFDATIYGYSS